MTMLKISDNKRFLIHDDGTPFFWLGDTAWEMIHLLTREEIELYLRKRAAQGFTVIQTVILAEMDGLRKPNAYGHVPLLTNDSGDFDPTLPALHEGGDDYWQHVDFVVNRAAALGLHVGLVPTWGDKVTMGNPFAKGPEIFNESNARAFGRIVGSRYRDNDNIIWILGGDRNPDGKLSTWREMAYGLKEGDGGRHLISYHPMGNYSSAIWFQHEDWLDYHTNQSGHQYRHLDNYNMIARDYHTYPPRPTFDGEPRYEGHSIGWDDRNGYFDDFDARQAAYWAVFAGAHGHTYGHTSLWQFYEPGRFSYSGAHITWQEAIDAPGAFQMMHLRNLIESRSFLSRVPDQELILDPLLGADHIRATRGGNYAFIYTPTGQAFDVRMGRISGEQVSANWMEPRTGEQTYIGTFENQGITRFAPPSSGIGNDWVLVLDDASPS
ncbi:MAG: glycoside hydrolase family 140 protein [Gorillibacterium sp.]|nr:glycoside hydrolase family 140 protein [Gorillibacterium sp.]